MLILRPEEVEGLLTFEETIAAVQKAFAEWGKDPEINLTRRRLHAGAARLNTMPGALPSRGRISVRIQCEILTESLTLLGAGKQASTHLAAMKAIRRLKKVKVFSRSRESRERFAKEMSSVLNLDVNPVESVKEAMEDADIILAATNTNVPVFPGEWLWPGVHVTSIVGSNVGMVKAGVIQQKRRELDDTTFIRADRIGITSRAQAIQDEQGDVFDQVQSGLISWDKIFDLRQIVTGQSSGRSSPTEITVFKNNGGQGIAELAIADFIVSKAREKKLGVEINWGEDY